MGSGRFDLGGKCAVVIGGTSGLGKAIALAIAEAGADVVAASRRREEAQKVAGEIEALGRRSLRATVDIRDRSSIESLQQKVLASFGKVDILVNAAGITLKTPTLECSEEGWNSIIDINLNGTWRCCQIFGKTMVAQGFGKILNIASLSTFVAFNQVAAYGVSKAGVGALTKSLADRTGSPQHLRECHRSRCLSHCLEPRADSGYGTGARVENAHPDEALWRDG